MKYAPVISLLFLSQFGQNEALRAMVMFVMNARSHNSIGEKIVDNLLEAGHEVVFVTCLPRNQNIPNLKEIDISPLGKAFHEQFATKFKLGNLVGKQVFMDPALFMYITSNYNTKLMESDIMKEFLSDPNEKFDVVIVEWLFSQLPSGIAALYKCPLVWAWTTEPHGSMLNVIDEYPNPAYNADLFSTIAPPFSFRERLSELWTAAKRSLMSNFVNYYLERSAYNSIYPELAAKKGVTLPSYADVAYNASLMLLNSHPSVGASYRLPQNVKYVGGFHVDTKVKPMPENINKIMNGSINGVIYFSMGSNIRSKDMPEEMIRDILDVFSRVKQEVIWKFEADLENVPSNVHLVKWAPQQNILAHPNLKFFITHGGQLSTTESIHFGVPVIGIPVYGDQHVNMQAIMRRGFGIPVNFDHDLAKNLEIAINEVLSNPSYAAKAKYLSSVYHDRLVPPGKEVVHWVEHVVKTQGAPHLRSPALMVSWYQKLYLDAILLLVIIVGVLYRLVKGFRNTIVKKVKKN